MIDREMRETNRIEHLHLLDPETHPVLGPFLCVLETERRDAILDYMRRSIRAKYELAYRLLISVEDVMDEYQGTAGPLMEIRNIELGEFDVQGNEVWQETLNAVAGEKNDSVLDEAWGCLQGAAETWGTGDIAEGKRMFALSKIPGTTILHRASIEEMQDA